MLVYINHSNYKTNQQRVLVDAELIKEFSTSVLVRLKDGSKIIRKKKRDFPSTEAEER